MGAASTADRVVTILVDHLGSRAREVAAAPETKMSALGADSLDVVELEMACEDAFGFRFATDDGFPDDPTFRQVVELIDAEVAASREPVAL